MSHAYLPISIAGSVRRLGGGLCLALALSACGGSGSDSSGPPAGSTAEARQAYLTSHIDAVLASRQKAADPGLSIVVIKNGVVTYSRSKGMADLGRNSAISENTVFELASLTKPITALAVMQLRDANLLALTDPVTKWLPQLPSAWTGITIHQLLSHQSGIPDYMSNILPSEVKLLDGKTNDDLLARFAADGHVNFGPGTKSEYSNSNYLLLAEIIARASGRSYAQYLQERVFTPLGMRSTYVFGSGVPQPGVEALNFARSVKPNPYDSTFATVGPIGVHSSAADLTLLVRALAAGQVVPMTTLTAMTSAQSGRAINTSGEFYGYGWYVPAGAAPLTVFAHTGQLDGFHHIIYADQTKELYYIVLENGGDATASVAAEVKKFVLTTYN
ncbi:serine hydrolase domain-containing protein [Massilia sp. TWP1-3-3]|uniref:serine hydrolase domain-containing protein n=1 Tax=Massilia sp. TWP1-3-3 TaxID=2804573 RepID=UPI003CF5C35E